MRTCREVTQLVSEGLDRPLSPRERVAVRLHVAICSVCRSYRRQVLRLNRLIRKGFQDGPPPGVRSDASLSDAARARIKERLAAEKR